jgi:hypothetical protein
MTRMIAAPSLPSQQVPEKLYISVYLRTIRYLVALRKMGGEFSGLWQISQFRPHQDTIVSLALSANCIDKEMVDHLKRKKLPCMKKYACSL